MYLYTYIFIYLCIYVFMYMDNSSKWIDINYNTWRDKLLHSEKPIKKLGDKLYLDLIKKLIYLKILIIFYIARMQLIYLNRFKI